MQGKNIAMIGAGNMARILSRYFTQAGHSVHIGAREPEDAVQLAKMIGHDAKGGAIDAALQHGDIVFFAVPYLQLEETARLAGPLTGKVVVDMSNPLKPDFSGLLVSGDTSAAEQLAKRLPHAKVVKAFNAVFATVLDKGPEFGSEQVQVFYAGDDEEAKQTVADIIHTAGFKAVDAGGLSSARYLEAIAALTIQVDGHLDRDVQIAAMMLERTK